MLISYLILCDVLHYCNYYTSPYTRVIPSLHQDIRDAKTSRVLQLQIMAGCRVPLDGSYLITYPDSQKVRLFGHKSN